MNILPVNQILHGNCKIVFTLVLIVLASCKPFSSTSNSYISKPQAISAALEVASTSGPEISGPHEEPSNISVQQTTLDEAVKKIGEHNQPATRLEIESSLSP